MQVFQCGDRVIYGIHGVCSIEAIEQRKIDRKTVEYYVLQPINGTGARFYVPTRNEAAVSKLHYLLTEQEVRDLLSSDEVRESSWIEDESLRKQQYKELLSGSDRAALIRMIRTLHLHKKQQTSLGKKFHQCDENFLRDAQKMVGCEISLALQIPESEVEAVVRGAIE